LKIINLKRNVNWFSKAATKLNSLLLINKQIKKITLVWFTNQYSEGQKVSWIFSVPSSQLE